MTRKMYIVKRRIEFRTRGSAWSVASRGARLEVVFLYWTDYDRAYLFDTERKADNFRRELEEMAISQPRHYQFKTDFVYVR